MNSHRVISLSFLFLCSFFLVSCSSGSYSDGYNKGFENGKDVGYSLGFSDGSANTKSEPTNDSYSDGYSDGYDEGFNSACAIILDRMDPDYREKWWNENIEDIMEYGIEY